MQKNISKKDMLTYSALIVLSIFFTIGDIVTSSTNHLIASSILSVITLIITFVGRHKAQAMQVSNGVDTTVDFIRVNFSRSNVILSMLDVVCSIIAILTSVLALALIFRCALAIKIFIYISRYRTIAVAVYVFIFTYLIKRRKNKMTEEQIQTEVNTSPETKSQEQQNDEKPKKSNFIVTAFKWIWANKKSICGSIFAIIGGVLSFIAVNSDLISSWTAIPLWGFNITPLIAAILVTCGVEIGTVGKGFETIKKFQERIALLKQEKAEKNADKIAAKEEKQKAKELKKALALKEKKDKEEAAKQAKAEHEAYLINLAEQELAKNESSQTEVATTAEDVKNETSQNS